MSMTPRDPLPGDDETRDVRPELADDLTALYARDVAVPARVDETIRSGARLAAARCRGGGRPSRGASRWMAAAAAAVLIAVSVWALRVERGAGPGDVDGDGRVDIVDAFVLARRVEAGAGVERRFDLNGDGRVDAGDVESLAARAVALGAVTE